MTKTENVSIFHPNAAPVISAVGIRKKIVSNRNSFATEMRIVWTEATKILKVVRSKFVKMKMNSTVTTEHASTGHSGVTTR